MVTPWKESYRYRMFGPARRRWSHRRELAAERRAARRGEPAINVAHPFVGSTVAPRELNVAFRPVNVMLPPAALPGGPGVPTPAGRQSPTMSMTRSTVTLVAMPVAVFGIVQLPFVPQTASVTTSAAPSADARAPTWSAPTKRSMIRSTPP